MGHIVQDAMVFPRILENVPAAQRVHSVAAYTVEYVPLGHCVHGIALVLVSCPPMDL